MREPGEGVGVAAAPEVGGPYVQSGGEWVTENVYGTEYQISTFQTAPLAATLAFQTFLKLQVTVGGGLYIAIGFMATTADSQNSRMEERITIQASDPVSINSGGSYSADGAGLVATQAATDGVGAGASFSVTVSGGEVVSIDSVITPGSGYAIGDTITLSVANEIVAAVVDVDKLPGFQSVVVSTTFTSVGDVLPITGRIPVAMVPGSHDIFTEVRQPASPGTVTAVAAGTELFRAL